MLPNISVGDPIRAVHLQQIVEEIRKNEIRPGLGLRALKTGTGTVLSVDDTIRRTSGGGVTNQENRYTPFRIVPGYPADPAFPVVRIQGESYISIIETGELYPITGDPGLGAILGSDDDNEDDPGQFPLPEIGQSIWLEITTNAFAVTSATIWFGQAGVDGWLNYPDPVEIAAPSEEDPTPTAISSRALIAHVVDATDPRHGDTYTVGEGETAETRKILQQLRTNLGIQVLMMRGVPCPVLVPWHGPFIIP
jgi:hypothetical protein